MDDMGQNTHQHNDDKNTPAAREASRLAGAERAAAPEGLEDRVFEASKDIAADPVLKRTYASLDALGDAERESAPARLENAVFTASLRALHPTTGQMAFHAGGHGAARRSVFGWQPRTLLWVGGGLAAAAAVALSFAGIFMVNRPGGETIATKQEQIDALSERVDTRLEILLTMLEDTSGSLSDDGWAASPGSSDEDWWELRESIGEAL